VTLVDVVVIGLPALLGTLLIASSARRAIRKHRFDGVLRSYRTAHLRLKEWMIRRNVLRFPGASLTESIRPWAAAEIVGLAVLGATLLHARDATAAVGGAAVAILCSACTAWISLRGSSVEALRSVRRDLPVACFLLSLLLESGMGPSLALQETAAAVPRGPLARELEELVRARSLGLSRTETLDRAGRRVPLEEYRLFLNHIRQGERLGIGLSGSLRGISEKMLENRDHEAETIAQQAAVKMLLPLVCFSFPAVFLIILSPVVLNLWERVVS
jgi:Flp pilus assembly protein TadB